MCRILGENCISAECMFKPRSCKDGTFNLGTQLETKGFTPKTIFKLASNIPRMVRIVGFHMTSLRFKLNNYRSYRDFTFTMH